MTISKDGQVHAATATAVASSAPARRTRKQTEDSNFASIFITMAIAAVLSYGLLAAITLVSI